MLCICEIHQLFSCITIAITCYIWCHKGKVLKENVSQLSWLHIVMCDTLQALYLCMYLKANNCKLLASRPVEAMKSIHPCRQAGGWLLLYYNIRCAKQTVEPATKLTILWNKLKILLGWFYSVDCGIEAMMLSHSPGAVSTYVLNNMSR